MASNLTGWKPIESTAPEKRTGLTDKAGMLMAQANTILANIHAIESRLCPPVPVPTEASTSEPAPDHIFWILETVQRRMNAIGETVTRISEAI
jgi:hypothetical protein